MPSKINVYMLEELQSQFADVQHCVVVAYTGVTSAEMTDLRAAIRKENGSLMVVKNTLASRAFRGLGRDEGFVALLDGPVALAYGKDTAGIVRAMTDWDKKKKKLAFRGGMLSGQAIAQAEVGRLASLPPMPVMQALALGAVAAPLTLFLGMCNEVIRSFMRVTEELAKKQEEAPGAPSAAPPAAAGA